jgi:hypothetical protein
MTLRRTFLACAALPALLFAPALAACASGPAPQDVAILDTPSASSGESPARAVVLPSGELTRDTEQRYEYLSDFAVFVGREVGTDKGLVLAFDANRGRDREKYAAEHFAVLWVEGKGWVELDVTATFKGVAEQFSTTYGAVLPSTDRAQVTGTAGTGLKLEVPKHALVLNSEPCVVETDQRNKRDGFVTGSSAGTLRYGEREFVGIVHHEFTYLAGVNPLAKTYTDLFGDGFHSVYGLVGTSGALRVHRSGGRLEPLIGTHSGFFAADAAARGTGQLSGLKLETSKKSLGGLFRWPGRYKTQATLGERNVAVQVDLKDRETLINYVFGGVAIAIAKGEVTVDGAKSPVLGFSLIVL